jgi:predicted transcriptional regulator of viral defense system
MFTDTEKVILVEYFRKPLRLGALREGAQTIMKKTRYKNSASFVRALLEEEIIRVHSCIAQNGRRLSLYSSQSFESQTPYEVALAMFPRGYFCNLSAVYYQSLTNQVPRTVYICIESNAKKTKRNDELTNSKLRQAFLKPHRHTRFIFDSNGFDIVVVERMKNTDSGVISSKTPVGLLPLNTRVAGVERALIDAVVSPQYNGGISSILDYFQNAKAKIDVTKLLDIYSRLDFVYPYFQALGFFLDRAGLNEKANDFRAIFPPKNKFYLDHSTKSSWKYDDTWMIYYPEGVVDEY